MMYRRSMPNRFYNPAYWLFCGWAFESMYWTLYWTIALIVALTRYARKVYLDVR